MGSVAAVGTRTRLMAVTRATAATADAFASPGAPAVKGVVTPGASGFAGLANAPAPVAVVEVPRPMKPRNSARSAPTKLLGARLARRNRGVVPNRPLV